MGRDGSELARELRAAFDASFAEAPPRPADDVPLLEVEVGEDVLAVPLTGLAAVVERAPIASLPGAPPSVLGLAGVRGELLSVHSLAALLGRTDHREGSRPLLVVHGTDQAALAVDRVRGLVRLPRASLPAAGAGRLVGVSEHAGTTWTVLDLGAAVAALQRRARPAGSGGRHG